MHRPSLVWKPIFTAMLLLLCRGKLDAAAVVSTVEYAKVGNTSLELDVRVPEGAGPFPIVLFVHGGGWSGGDKREIEFLSDELLRANFTSFSINYRLAPTHRWPDGFDDVQTAIRWAKAHAGEYKGNPHRLGLLGYSAGGHLACLAAAQAGRQARPQAVVGFAPPTDLVADSERRGGLSPSLQSWLNRPHDLNADTRQFLYDISPINHVHRGLPPFLLVHGTEDRSVPYSQSLHFQARLQECAVPCRLITIPGAPHRIADWKKFDPHFAETVVQWLQATLANGARRPLRSPKADS